MYHNIIIILSWILALGIAIPLTVFGLETLLAVFSRHGKADLHLLQNASTTDDGPQHSRPRLAILVPAHDEESGIAHTLNNIKIQLTPQDRLIVIADNCTDATAVIARQTGAEVLERCDHDHRGKGYALAHGINYLANSSSPAAKAPDVVLIIDADCLLAPGTLNALATAAVTPDQHGRFHPAQAIYLMNPPPENIKNEKTPPNAAPKPSSRNLISALAFLFKNQVRPLGLSMLNGPCLLTGTGMAFSWQILNPSHDHSDSRTPSTKISLATGNIVEDMQLGLDLALLGQAPKLCPEALVMGTLPTAGTAAKVQRQRWEHGHLQTLLVQCPGIIFHGVSKTSWPLLLLGMDLLVPPLSLLIALWVFGMSATIMVGLLDLGWIPALLLVLTGGWMALGVFAGWYKFARAIVPGQLLLLTPLYILWKLPMYLGFLFRRQKTWIRTARN